MRSLASLLRGIDARSNHLRPSTANQDAAPEPKMATTGRLPGAAGWSRCPAIRPAERRRNRTFQAWGCHALPALKAGWATRPVPLRGRAKQPRGQVGLLDPDRAGLAVLDAPDVSAGRAGAFRCRHEQAAGGHGVAEQPAVRVGHAV